MTKSGKLIITTLCAMALIWGGMFAIDYTRCSSLKEPVFVVARGNIADDSGSGSYQGLGYSVELEKRTSAEFGCVVESVEMSIFGKIIAASIT